LDGFSPHAHLQTLLKPTVLALVPVMLIDGTVPVPSTRVREISSYTSLEEALATFTRELAVVLAAGFVPTHDTFDVLVLVGAL
jgi:hypothetical protein